MNGFGNFVSASDGVVATTAAAFAYEDGIVSTYIFTPGTGRDDCPGSNGLGGSGAHLDLMRSPAHALEFVISGAESSSTALIFASALPSNSAAIRPLCLGRPLALAGVASVDPSGQADWVVGGLPRIAAQPSLSGIPLHFQALVRSPSGAFSSSNSVRTD